MNKSNENKYPYMEEHDVIMQWVKMKVIFMTIKYVGFDLSKEEDVEYYAYVPCPYKEKAFIREVESLGYTCEKTDKLYLLIKTRMACHDNRIVDAGLTIENLVKKYGGDYGGFNTTSLLKARNLVQKLDT